MCHFHLLHNFVELAMHKAKPENVKVNESKFCWLITPILQRPFTEPVDW